MNKLLSALWQAHREGRGIAIAGTAHQAFDILRLLNTVEYPTFTDTELAEDNNWN